MLAPVEWFGGVRVYGCVDSSGLPGFFVIVSKSEGDDKLTIKIHEEANAHVQKNQKHVLWAYAAMWIVAAGFVIYLWRRQQALKLEIAQLRKDLDAAAANDRAAAPPR